MPMGNEVQIVLTGVDQASSVIKGVGGELSGLGGIAGGVLSAGLAVAAAGVAALGAGLAVSLKEAMDAQQVQASLAAVLKSTGGAAGLTQAAANALAMQFRDLAGGSDDAILAIEEIGLRAGSISAEEMPAFIQATLDLGAVMKDTSGAATILARAQEDPIAALGRLQRAGIIFTDSQKDQIKAMVEAGDMAGATAVLMGRVGEATAGLAAAGAATFSGQLEIMKGHLLEAAETVGTALLPILTHLFEDVVKPALPLIEAFAKTIADLFTQMAAGDLTPLTNLIPPEIAEKLGSLGMALQGLADAFIASLPQIKGAGEEMARFLQEAFALIGPQIIENVTGAINAITALWQAHGATILAILTLAWQIIVAVIGGALTLISGIVSAALQLLSGDWQGALNTMGATLESFFNLALSIVGTNMTEFRATWQANWDAVVLIVSTIMLQAIGAVQNTISQFTTIGKAIVDGMIAGIQGAVGGLVAEAANAALSAFNAAKAALGIHSPSALFAELGMQSVAGMAQGIRAGGAGEAGQQMGGRFGSAVAAVRPNLVIQNVNLADEMDLSRFEGMLRRVMAG